MVLFVALCFYVCVVFGTVCVWTCDCGAVSRSPSLRVRHDACPYVALRSLVFRLFSFATSMFLCVRPIYFYANAFSISCFVLVAVCNWSCWCWAARRSACLWVRVGAWLLVAFCAKGWLLVWHLCRSCFYASVHVDVMSLRSFLFGLGAF